MEVLTRTELKLREKEIIQKIQDGSIFIYPTDTIYGIGCNALNEESVQKIRKMKGRPGSPLSIWVPSKEWITKNCDMPDVWLDKLPGPYTLIVPIKNELMGVSKETIGVRLPDHWFHSIVEKVGVPIITTSANRLGQRFMTSIENFDKNINVEFLIYEGEKLARPSKIINLTTNETKER